LIRNSKYICIFRVAGLEFQQNNNFKKDMKNLFYFAADGRRQKPDGILYRLPTWHPIYSMPFGQSENVKRLFIIICPLLSAFVER